MLILKVVKHNMYGNGYPQGFTTSEHYYKLEDDMTVRDVDGFIRNLKLREDDYTTYKIELVKIIEDIILW